jgi:asparagine synthase (glutamine-hydrolysing)
LSAFAVVYERSGAQFDPCVLERVMARLSHRGPDGSDATLTGHIAMGHWHFWTTPEEVGEAQPLDLDGLPFKLVFDGRIDNRSDLLDDLRIDHTLGECLSDAALVLRAYAFWGEDCVTHFIGEFSFVIFDEKRNEIFCARDPLGNRTFFYSYYQTLLVIASEPWAVAGATLVNPELDERALAYYFALMAPEDGQTLFNGIYELLPAHIMLVKQNDQHIRRYWQPDPLKKIRYSTDEEYAEHLLYLLEESVHCRMRSQIPVGVLMSGGLDSTSVACLAARMMPSQQFTTISYVFDELPDCDEREYINAVADKWNIHSVQIPCDDAWPYKDWGQWYRNPNDPEGNLYRLVKERAFKRTHDEGLRVLLTGGFGDHLYDGVENWMADLLEDGFMSKALQGFVWNIRYFGLYRTLAAGSFRRVIKSRLPRWVLGIKNLSVKENAFPWLTDFAHAKIDQSGTWLDPALASKSNLFGLMAAKSCTDEIHNASRYAFEFRNPYRDFRLVEFFSTIPAYQLYSPGIYKYLLRTAMKNILPEQIRTRSHKSSMRSMFFRGIKNEKTVLQSQAQKPNASWRKYVNSNWMSAHWDASASNERNERYALIPWLCFSYEAWQNS